jgi:hypothetical protein
MQRLGIKDRLEYDGREYEEHGIEWCEVTIYVGKSEDFLDVAEAWSMTMTGFWFADTYHVVALKVLRYLCQIYEKPIARTPMRFFPPVFFDEAGGATPLLEFYLIFKNRVCTRVFLRYIKGNKENSKDYTKPSSH